MAAHPSWGSGFPNCQGDKIATVVVSDLRLGARREIIPLVAVLVTRLERARGKKFRPSPVPGSTPTSGGFACRAIAGTQTPSNHSWGLAVDLDAPDNPQLTAELHRQPHPLRKEFPGGRVMRSTMPMEAEAIADRLMFRWGGTFVTKPDPMHFEFMGSVADAERLSRGVEKKVGDRLRRGDGGPGVKRAQQLLKEAGFDPGRIDGDFGENTERAVNAFKAANDLEVNGVVGTKMWRLLRKQN